MGSSDVCGFWYLIDSNRNAENFGGNCVQEINQNLVHLVPYSFSKFLQHDMLGI